MHGRRDLIKVGVTVVMIYLSYVLGKGVLQLYRAKGRIGEAQEELQKSKVENTQLKKELAQTQTQEFIEKEARDKLNMQLPGETVIIMPESELRIGGEEGVKEEKPKANWEKWWELFK